MEAAATLFLDTDNHAKSDIDWNICIICQERKFPKQKFPLPKGTIAGISRVLDCAGIREHVQEDTYKHCSEIVNCLEEKGNQDAFCHRQCYTDFTNKGHIQRLQKRVSDSEKADEMVLEGTFSRRSSLERMDWSKGSTKTRNPESGHGNGITETETETNGNRIRNQISMIEN